MTAVDKCVFDPDLRDAVSLRASVGDGDMGTRSQSSEPALGRVKRLGSRDEVLDQTSRMSARRNAFGCNLVEPSGYGIADNLGVLLPPTS